MKKNVQRGFTLIEVMVVLVVVAILAGVAYPSYQESVRKTKRAEGRAALMRDMQQEERDYSRNNFYTEFKAGDLKNYRGYSGDGGGGSYTITAAACTGLTINDCVLLTATPNNFADAKCGNLTLDNRGIRGAAGKVDPEAIVLECWK